MENIIKEVSQETGIPYNTVNSIFKEYWKCIRNIMSGLKLKEDLTEEQFNALRPNISIGHIGKFYITYDRYKRIKSNYNNYSKNTDD